ncbi:MAG: methyltransferase domain-containing protein [Alphaproteobacteria bacterium]|nr:methyltransferase domain-containing protein [Alphaproteobacteria bacterium]
MNDPSAQTANGSSMPQQADRRYRPTRLMKLMLALGPRLRVGTLDVTLPDGSTRRFGGAEPGPAADLTIRSDTLARRFLTRGNLGFCEGYIEGDWVSDDVERLFVFFLMNQDALADEMAGKAWVRVLQRLVHMMRPNDRTGARRNIAAHYDLGNAFYEKWLDPSMTYSSAVFGEGEEDLTAAQRRKYALLAERMDLGEGDHVLEIGCGWGGFAEFAAAERGAKVTAITISREQHAYASRRIQAAGLADKVEVRLQDYRDTDGRFDRIASIEMFEAVGEKYWPQFFGTLRDRLAPGGTAALQVITIADRFFDQYRRSADYIQRYIFPGGMLPSPEALGREVERAGGLRLAGMTGFRHDYAVTLREWNQRFQDAWPDIRALGFDERFKRMWEQYLHYCAAGFQVGTIDVKQLAIVRD